jgi:L-seryl-tRNA(Ser) seleniumtransferase
MNDPRRALPSVELLIGELADSLLPHGLLADIARRTVDAARREIEAGATPARADIVDRARVEARRVDDALFTPVINATGVLLHTNLGRAPLGAAARDALIAAGGPVNVEYRLADGRRGSRHDHAGQLLAIASGAEAGLVVNNNAAAVMLVLAALARGREVVVSRGELVEIGGGFRVPDVLRESGARLIEVGTTNRTRAADFAGACSPDTAMLLRVHASNYRMVGFTEQPAIAELAAIGPPVVVDAGSGLLDATTPWLDTPPNWLGDEPGVRQCLEYGAALVTFSGDKLLGGPQAGVIVGRRTLVEECKRHPLARALRADKLTLAALQSVAFSYLANTVSDDVPVWQMATTSLRTLRTRADTIVAQVPGSKIVDTDAAAGGGSVPGTTIPSVGIAIPGSDIDAMLATLRAERVIALARDGAVVADLRTVAADDDERLIAALHNLAR